MTRRPMLRPMLGLVVLLVAFAVVAMHQLGAGHQPAMHQLGAGHQPAMSVAGGMSAGHGGSAGVSVIAGAQSAVPFAEDAERGCGAGCAAAGAHEPPIGGHGAVMLCLAMLPLLLGLFGRRRALLTRWHLALADAGALRWAGRKWLADSGPLGTSLSRLCVSRT